MHLTDEQLLAIGERFAGAGAMIGGFHYGKHHVIRDYRKKGDGVIWRGPVGEVDDAYWDQLTIEKMRYALEILDDGSSAAEPAQERVAEDDSEVEF